MPVLPTDDFSARHLGPRAAEIQEMLALLGYDSLDALTEAVVPGSIRTPNPLTFPAMDEVDALAALRGMAEQNRVSRSYIGMGYSGTVTPPVILRNILENPGWYTAYTPYQAEIAQGRLEALFTYQTMIQDLTGLEVANASLLDEGTAAAEAMAMSHRLSDGEIHSYFVSDACHPQTISIVQTRAKPLGINVIVGDASIWDWSTPVFGALLQYPDTHGDVRDLSGFCADAHARGALVTVATDLLALVLLRSPGSMGADIAVGSAQRFGVPMGYGGPHAAFMAAGDSHKRQMPGRIIGMSRDAAGRRALRMSLQTREQHIRREKATSNICTAQVLLAVIAGMYAVYHGSDGLRRIAGRTHQLTKALANGLASAGYKRRNITYFDTVEHATPGRQAEILAAAEAVGINLRAVGDDAVSVSLDETTGPQDVADLLRIFGVKADVAALIEEAGGIPEGLAREGEILAAPVFHLYRSEHELLRYIHRLQAKDLSLTTSMIPLGSCTMKLNATTEMIPVTWPGFGAIHPFAPREQTKGYTRLFDTLNGWLQDITGFDAMSLQPNAGSQGEYAGLLTIRRYHEAQGNGHRTVCLIPTSAHGTNPASAIMAGMEVVTVACDDHGNIDVADLTAKADANADRLGALMVTYPSTHGVFEGTIKEVCAIIHKRGGQVYLDGANMNALVGLCKPAELGADVCHLNLHKTFCIPHGGGGPGMGPIGVKAHLAPHLPCHPVVPLTGEQTLGTISAAPWGSASILPISWAYIAMMGGEGLKRATQIAILNANYIAKRVGHAFPVLYTGANGHVAHECILDLRHWKAVAGIEPDDVAKRLMDYGFHAPTMSWPVPVTLMVEPTESESKAELDRFCEALLSIHQEILDIVEGRSDKKDNPLKRAPHPADVVVSDGWDRSYSREKAAYPGAWLKNHKYWPTVSRVDNVWGDRNLRTGWAKGEQPT